jgi:hypothetical protein
MLAMCWFPQEVYDRVKALLQDEPPTIEEQKAYLSHMVTIAGWDDPEMDIYDDMKCKSLIHRTIGHFSAPLMQQINDCVFFPFVAIRVLRGCLFVLAFPNVPFTADGKS